MNESIICKQLSPQEKVKNFEASFVDLPFFHSAKTVLSIAIGKKVKFDEARRLFSTFVSKVITTAHAHKSGVIFHIFQDISC